MNAVAEYYRRKADQEYEMAGCAARDGDKKAVAEHTTRAKEYEQLAREASS